MGRGLKVCWAELSGVSTLKSPNWIDSGGGNISEKTIRLARFFSAFFIVTLALSAFVALNVHYGAGLGEVLIPWFKVDVVLGIAYAYITYLEFTASKTKKGLSPWAAERVAQSLVPWLVLDLALLFGIIIPLGGYIAGIIYNSHGLL